MGFNLVPFLVPVFFEEPSLIVVVVIESPRSEWLAELFEDEGLSAAFSHRAKIAAWAGPRRAGWIAGPGAV